MFLNQSVTFKHTFNQLNQLIIRFLLSHSTAVLTAQDIVDCYERRWVFNENLKILTEGAALISNCRLFHKK